MKCTVYAMFGKNGFPVKKFESGKEARAYCENHNWTYPVETRSGEIFNYQLKVHFERGN